MKTLIDADGVANTKDGYYNISAREYLGNTGGFRIYCSSFVPGIFHDLQISLNDGSSWAGFAEYGAGGLSGTTQAAFNIEITHADLAAQPGYSDTEDPRFRIIHDYQNNGPTVGDTVVPALDGGAQDFQIDLVRPNISSVTSSTGNGTYIVGNNINVSVNFSEVTTVSGGNLLVELETGITDRTVTIAGATYSNSASGTYQVQSGDESSDLSVKSISKSGGTIRDAADNDLDSYTIGSNLDVSSNLVVDGIIPTITNVTSPIEDGSYKAGDLIPITIEFSEAVTVNTGGGIPRLTLETGTSDAVVDYSGGTGTSILTFDYTIAAPENKDVLDYISPSALVLNGGTIKDAAGNNAVLALFSPGSPGSLGDNKNITIDTVVPTVVSVTSSKTDGVYKQGENILITITFSEAVDVTGAPTLALNSGGVANYTSGTGNSVLTFSYSVGAGENSSDLDYAATSSLVGTIKDAALNAANLTLPATGSGNSLGGSTILAIDTTPPEVSGVSSTTDGTKKIGDIIPITVTFDETVYVPSGTPQITLETGTTDATAFHDGNDASMILTLNYTVLEGHTTGGGDLDYTTNSALAGVIQDEAGNSANLTLPNPGGIGSLANNKNIIIDGIRPTVSAVTSSTLDGHYNAADEILILATFTEVVTVSGAPQINADVVGGGYPVNYTSGSPGTTLTFNYTVQSGDSQIAY